jgi:hypothetical protein
MEYRIFFIFTIFTIFWVCFSKSSFVFSKIKAPFTRCAFLLVCICIVTVFVSCIVWRFDTYDDKSLNTYRRILPFKNSPYFQIGRTLEFNNISAIIEHGSGTTSGYGFRLKTGEYRGFDFAHIPIVSRAKFIFTLYDNCEWLRDNIKDNFPSILAQRNIYESETISVYRSLQGAFVFMPIIWLLIMELLFIILSALGWRTI